MMQPGDEISATVHGEVVELRTCAGIPGAVVELHWPRIDRDGAIDELPVRIWVALEALATLSRGDDAG